MKGLALLMESLQKIEGRRRSWITEGLRSDRPDGCVGWPSGGRREWPSSIHTTRAACRRLAREPPNALRTRIVTRDLFGSHAHARRVFTRRLGHHSSGSRARSPLLPLASRPRPPTVTGPRRGREGERTGLTVRARSAVAGRPARDQHMLATTLDAPSPPSRCRCAGHLRIATPPARWRLVSARSAWRRCARRNGRRLRDGDDKGRWRRRYQPSATTYGHADARRSYPAHASGNRADTREARRHRARGAAAAVEHPSRVLTMWTSRSAKSSSKRPPPARGHAAHPAWTRLDTGAVIGFLDLTGEAGHAEGGHRLLRSWRRRGGPAWCRRTAACHGRGRPAAPRKVVSLSLVPRTLLARAVVSIGARHGR